MSDPVVTREARNSTPIVIDVTPTSVHIDALAPLDLSAARAVLVAVMSQEPERITVVTGPHVAAAYGLLPGTSRFILDALRSVLDLSDALTFGATS